MLFGSGNFSVVVANAVILTICTLKELLALGIDIFARPIIHFVPFQTSAEILCQWFCQICFVFTDTGLI